MPITDQELETRLALIDRKIRWAAWLAPTGLAPLGIWLAPRPFARLLKLVLFIIGAAGIVMTLKKQGVLKCASKSHASPAQPNSPMPEPGAEGPAAV